MTTFTPLQLLITVAALTLGTQITRWLPFLLFPPQKKTPELILRLGRLLPYAVTGLLVVYCLRDSSFSSIDGFLPQGLAIMAIFLLHSWKHNALLSIGAGTVLYMLLTQLVFS